MRGRSTGECDGRRRLAESHGGVIRVESNGHQLAPSMPNYATTCRVSKLSLTNKKTTTGECDGRRRFAESHGGVIRVESSGLQPSASMPNYPTTDRGSKLSLTNKKTTTGECDGRIRFA